MAYYCNKTKRTELSKYIYQNHKGDTQIYVFELILKTKSNQLKIIRCIKKCKYGNLISDNDNIEYDTIDKYKLTVFNLNNPDNSIIIKDTVNHKISSNTFITNDICLKINQASNNMLNFKYYLNIM
jgi:hypothetical protein